MNIRHMALHLALARKQARSAAPANTRAIATAQPRVTYAICTNPRSGSWLLSEALAATGVAGNPREWFNISEEQNCRARWRMDHDADLSAAAYLDLLKRESTTRNGVRGIKLHWYQFAEWPQRVAAIDGLRGLNSTELMRRIFPAAKFIWLTRRDKVGQAISFVMASRTNVWWSISGAPPDRGALAPGGIAFDGHETERTLRVLEESDANWQAWFAGQRVEPLVIHYEDLEADYERTVTEVLKWLGIAGAETIAIAPARLLRQATAQNDEWRARFAEFKRDGTLLSGAAASATIGAPNPLPAIRYLWKQWIGKSKLLKTKDDAIVDGLVRNGYTRDLARAEVEKASADPYLPGAVRAGRPLRKSAALVDALDRMARLASDAVTVDVRSDLSRGEFRDRYYAANRPIVLKGLMTGWRAMTAWTPDALKHVAGDKTIEVMTRRNTDPHYERNAAQHRTQMRFSDYIDLVHSGAVTNDYCLVPNNRFFQNPEMAPFLDDCPGFADYLNPATASRQTFLWFGPAGALTPLHHATCNVLNAQVTGRKRYRLIASTQADKLYNSAGVYSDVDGENPDFVRFPAFRDARVIDVVVGPGDVLFVPVGWWWHVRSLDVAMTVAFTNFLFENHFNWEQ